MVSDCGKGPQSAGQVCDEKTNVCEPLLTHRETNDGIETGGVVVLPGQRRARGACPQPGSGLLAGPGGVRCIGGVSSSQALAWNRRTCRLDTDGQSKWVSRPPGREREDPKRQTPRGAEYRCEAQGRTGP